MRLFKRSAPTEEEFETQQQKLRRLSGEVLDRYRREMAAEISDPERLAAVYGAAFATAETRRQGEVVAEMAANMLHVPHAAITLVNPRRQEMVALVKDHEIAPDPSIMDGDYSESYCKNVIATGRELAIEVAIEHPLVCDTQLAISGAIVSYLGVPVASREGVIVGVLCVWDAEQRAWTSADVSMLTQLSMVLTRSMPVA